MVTDEQVKDAVEQILRTYPVDWTVTQIENCIREKIKDLGADYDPEPQAFIPGGEIRKNRIAMVNLLGPTGEVLQLSASEEYRW